MLVLGVGAGLVMGCSFIGFGALIRSLDFGLIPAFFTIGFIWALPGQLILVEMHTLGAPFVALLLSVGPSYWGFGSRHLLLGAEFTRKEAHLGVKDYRISSSKDNDFI